MEEIDFMELLLIIKKRLWAVILVTVFFAGASGLISYYVLEPEYETYTTLIVGRPQDYQKEMEYNDVLLNQKLVSTYGEIAKSRAIANELIAGMGLNLTYEQLSRKISVTLMRDTEIIKISVRDRDSLAAAQIANETAKVFMRQVARIMNIANVQVIDTAEVPTKPIKPKPVVNITIAAALGCILSIGIFLIYEYFDNTMKTPEDIEKCLGLPVIGVVPKVTCR